MPEIPANPVPSLRAFLGQIALSATTTYTPVSQADYQDGKVKIISMTSVAAVVDNVQYLYALTITDESGANAIPGALYAAYRVFYS